MTIVSPGEGFTNTVETTFSVDADGNERIHHWCDWNELQVVILQVVMDLMVLHHM